MGNHVLFVDGMPKIRKGRSYSMRKTHVHGLNISAVKFRNWNLPLRRCSERPHALSVVTLGTDTSLLGKAGTPTVIKFSKV